MSTKPTAKERQLEAARRRRKRAPPKVTPIDKIKVRAEVPFRPTAIFDKTFETQRGDLTRYFAKGTIPSGEVKTRSVNKGMAAGLAETLGREKLRIKIGERLTVDQEAAAKRAKVRSAAVRAAPSGGPVMPTVGRIGLAALKPPKATRVFHKAAAATAKTSPMIDLSGFKET